MSNSPVAVIGSTGLVGSNILSTLLASSTTAPVTTITRRAPRGTGPNLNAVVETDTAKWAAALSAATPIPAAVFSALGTTRAAAGGVANQWKIDHDLNIELAKAARAAGVRTFVFISGVGVRGMLAKHVPYSQMKVGVEDAVRDLDFDHGIIVRPPMILGERETSRPAEGLMQNFFRGLRRVHQGWGDFFGQDAEVIARAAVHAAQLAEEGKAPSKYWTLEWEEIVRLGRTEWPPAGAEQKVSGEVTGTSEGKLAAH